MQINYMPRYEAPPPHGERYTAYVRIWTPRGARIVRLGDGDAVEMYHGYYTDEGHCFESEFFLRRNDTLIRRSVTDSTDCDGRFATSAEYKATLLDEAHLYDHPLWQRENYRQRDYQAEAAGY
jgi:hypothetical protein